MRKIASLWPGGVRTRMLEALSRTVVDYMTANTRCGELDEASQMILWVPSPACGFTTGLTFDLSSGGTT